MMMLGDVGTFVLGAVLLLLGTDSLVKGLSAMIARGTPAGFASALAATALNALLPAAIVAAAAIARGQLDLALGSVVGGAIAQLGLVLGIAALAAPLFVRLKVFAWINPILLLVVLLVGVLAIDGRFGTLDAAILLAAFLIVALLVVRAARAERIAARALFASPLPHAGVVVVALRVAIGAALAGYGGWWLVAGSVAIANAAAWNPLLVGLLGLGAVTALASAPSAIALARRGHGDFAVGQSLLGAVCNLLLVLGVLVAWHPLALPPSLLRIELPALFALALAVYPMMRSDGELSRREGSVLLVAWLLFVAVEVWLTAA